MFHCTLLHASADQQHLHQLLRLLLRHMNRPQLQLLPSSSSPPLGTQPCP
jgi:hypothetical protein